MGPGGRQISLTIGLALSILGGSILPVTAQDSQICEGCFNRQDIAMRTDDNQYGRDDTVQGKMIADGIRKMITVSSNEIQEFDVDGPELNIPVDGCKLTIRTRGGPVLLSGQVPFASKTIADNSRSSGRATFGLFRDGMLIATSTRGAYGSGHIGDNAAVVFVQAMDIVDAGKHDYKIKVVETFGLASDTVHQIAGDLAPCRITALELAT